MKDHISAIFIIFLLIPVFLTGGNPMPGQIIVDTGNPRWLKYNGGGPFFMCGPGDPEGFLYLGERNSDGTRNGNQMELINKLKNTGANSIYLMAVRSHGGDGDETQNPFVNSDPNQGMSDDILDQWESWFSAMDDAGIVIFFIFYDDGSRIWDTGDNVSSTERNFIQTLVNRFKHHKHLIWCIAEEYGEKYSAARMSGIAAVIKEMDEFNHVVAVHKNEGLDFSEFANDPNIEQFAIQYNVSSAEALHTGMLTAWDKANGRYNLNMSESYDHGSGPSMRLKNWAIAMGGAYVMVLFMDIENTSLDDLRSCGYLRKFFEQTDFHKMSPADELKAGETRYILANPGESYILYTNNSGELGLKEITDGNYSLIWFDPLNGEQIEKSNINLGGEVQYFTRPSSMGSEVALYLKRSEKEGGNTAPHYPTGLRISK